MAKSKDTGGLLLLGAGLALFGLAVSGSSKKARPPSEDDNLHRFMLGQLQRVAFALGHSAPPLVHDPSSGAAHATGGRIHYAPAWVKAKLAEHCNSAECAQSVIAGIVAHEFAHITHGDGYSPSRQHNHTVELRADRVAGRVLGKLGHTPEDLQKVFLEFDRLGSHTHPAAHLRVAEISSGFERARAGRHWA